MGRVDALRIDFLNANLDLAFTFCQTAEIANESEHQASLYEKVRKVISVVRTLQDWVSNAEERFKIARRLAELEARAASLSLDKASGRHVSYRR